MQARMISPHLEVRASSVLTFLIDPERGQAIKHPWTDVFPPIGYDTYDDLCNTRSAQQALLCLSSTARHLTFFQLPGPHVPEFFLPSRWPMFLMTPCNVRKNKISSSLYIVMTIMSSVSRS